MILLIKSFLNPIFLIRIICSSNNIFLSPLHISFNIFALIFIIDYIFPRISPICIRLFLFNLFLLRFDNNSHLVFTCFISSTSRDTRFCKVHDIKCIILPLNTSCGPKVKPLLMTSSVGINLHE